MGRVVNNKFTPQLESEFIDELLSRTQIDQIMWTDKTGEGVHFRTSFSCWKIEFDYLTSSGGGEDFKIIVTKDSREIVICIGKDNDFFAKSMNLLRSIQDYPERLRIREIEQRNRFLKECLEDFRKTLKPK